jgi:hypothetical protein
LFEQDTVPPTGVVGREARVPEPLDAEWLNIVDDLLG